MGSSTVIQGLGGFVCQRQGINLDYSFRLAIESLLKVCEQVVACDSDSSDGSREELQRMAEKEPRIKLINWEWKNPKGVSHHAWVEWLNYARKNLDTPMSIYLDADEVLDDRPECYEALREAVVQKKSLRVDRLNLYKSPELLIPFDKCCGKWVVRVGPSKYESVSDQPVHPGEYQIVDEAVEEPRVKIWHLGFLRDQKAFYRKARAVFNIWEGGLSDRRLIEAEEANKPVWEAENEWINDLVPHNEGYYPKAVKKWLEDRGHFVI